VSGTHTDPMGTFGHYVQLDRLSGTDTPVTLRMTGSHPSCGGWARSTTPGCPDKSVFQAMPPAPIRRHGDPVSPD